MTVRTLALIGLGALALQGCAAARPAETLTILRAAPRFEAASVAQGRPALAVAPVLGGGVVDGRRYVYVDRAAPGVVRQASSLFWDEAPPRLFERALVDGLRARLGAVTGPDTPVSAPRRLTVRLERFEEAEGGGAPADATVDISATEIGPPDRAVVLSGRYCAAVPIAGPTSSDRARAFEAAMKQVILALGRDLESGAASHAC